MEQNTAFLNDYIANLFAPQDEVLTETLALMRENGVPGINVSPVEGQTLHLLALLARAERILEIGTLGGYSGIHLARALPKGGKLVTLELEAHHAQIAQQNFERAGLAEKVEIRLGPAAQSLRQLAQENAAPFDLVFIDADKDGYVEYLELALPLLREGGLLLGDNTLQSAGQSEGGTHLYNVAVSQKAELTSVILPILRGRGLDGLTVSIKRALAG